jgi:iron complex outermembrane receptor protein
MRFVWIRAVVLLVLLAPPAQAARDGELRGRVSGAGGAALARATVSLDGTGFRTLTDDTGAYALVGVPVGTYTLRVRVIGYAVATARVVVEHGATGQHDVTLIPSAIGLAPVDVVVGSRARHSASDELAVPVDIFEADDVASQGTSETSDILARLAPSVVFPRQSISDGTDVVRPFVLRGLSPDHTLVLVNGKRRHATALVHVFGVSVGAGPSGVDLNAIPSSAIERIEVLRDGAAAQYGSDAIAGVVNVVLKEGVAQPQVTLSAGRFTPSAFPADGDAIDVAAAWGVPLGRGSVTLLAERRSRESTNRAGADPYDQLVPGDGDLTDPETNALIEKRNPVPQPTYHWGDGAASDWLGMVNARLPLGEGQRAELYGFGGASVRAGTGNGFRRSGLSERNWPEIHPLGFLPEFAPDVMDLSGTVGVRGLAAGWSYDVSGSYGASDFEFELNNTLNVSLGPCLTLDPAVCASPPLGPDSVAASGDEIPNQTSFFAGALRRRELAAAVEARRPLPVSGPATLAVGAALRRERYEVEAGEPASYVQGWHADRYGDPAPSGAQVFPGFRPTHAADVSRTTLGVHADLEAGVSASLLGDLAARLEHSSDFGTQVTGKLALRHQPVPALALRGAVSTGYRAPGLSQGVYASTVTNFDPGTGALRDVVIFPVASPGAQALGATPLDAETSTSASLGFAWSPGRAWRLTVDGFVVTVRDRILLTSELGGAPVTGLLTAAGEPDVAAARFFANALDTDTRGVDVTLRYARRAGRVGWVTITGAFNYTATEVVGPIPTVPTTSVPLFDDGGLNAVTRERPRWQARLAGRYANGRWSGLVRAQLYGSYRSSVWSFSEYQYYGEELTLDVELSRAFINGVTVRLGVRNLLDNFPDRTGPANSFGIMQWPTASPFGFNGRFVYAGLETRLGA